MGALGLALSSGPSCGTYQLGMLGESFMSPRLFTGPPEEGDKSDLVWIKQSRALPSYWLGKSAQFNKYYSFYYYPGRFKVLASDNLSEESLLWLSIVEGICTYKQEAVLNDVCWELSVQLFS